MADLNFAYKTMSDEDMVLVKKIISVVSERGAIKPDEFIVVGELVQRIDSMLSQADAPLTFAHNPEPELLCEHTDSSVPESHKNEIEERTESKLD